MVKVEGIGLGAKDHPYNNGMRLLKFNKRVGEFVEHGKVVVKSHNAAHFVWKDLGCE